MYRQVQPRDIYCFKSSYGVHQFVHEKETQKAACNVVGMDLGTASLKSKCTTCQLEVMYSAERCDSHEQCSEEQRARSMDSTFERNWRRRVQVSFFSIYSATHTSA